MRVLYFCPEYFADHGARTHAREFFHALENVPGVEAATIFGSEESTSLPSGAKKKKGGRARFLPKKIRTLWHFWKPKRQLTQRVVNDLKSHQCDVLIVRSGVVIPCVKTIRQHFPALHVCFEINSAFFDEFLHDIPFRRVLQNLEVKRFSRADSFFVVSSYLEEYLSQRGLDKERILVNQNAVNTKSFYPIEKDYQLAKSLGLQIPENAVVLGYVGGMEVFRRLPEVIDHFKEIRQQGHEKAFLLLVGDGSDREKVEARIQANMADIDGWVKCLGWQPYENIPRLISLFDIAIFPFTNPYCSPLKLFEYLAMEKTVLGPDTPAVKEVFSEGTHLMLVKEDGSDFLDKIKFLIESPEVRQSLAKQGREHVVANYTWEKNASNVVRHINQCSHKTIC